MNTELTATAFIVEAGNQLFEVVKKARDHKSLISGFRVRHTRQPMQFNYVSEFFGAGYVPQLGRDLLSDLALDSEKYWKSLIALHSRLSIELDDKLEGRRDINFGFLFEIQSEYPTDELRIRRLEVDTRSLDKQQYRLELIYADDWVMVLWAVHEKDGWAYNVGVEFV